MKRLHTCQQPLTLSYCNQGKENGKRNWLQKKAHTHLCLKHHPQITKLEWSWDFIREHGTKNIDIHNLDASGQLCRICISISSASYPCDVTPPISLWMIYIKQKNETLDIIITLVSGNKESGTGCVFGSGIGIGIGSGSGNDIFENSYFDFDFYWTCIFYRNAYCWLERKIEVHLKTIFWSRAKH